MNNNLFSSKHIKILRKRIYLMRPSIDNNEVDAIKHVFKSKFLTEGRITKKFEIAISNYVII